MKTKQYHQLLFEQLSADKMEQLNGLLSVLDTEGVEEGEDSLTVFVEDALYDETAMQEIAEQLGITYTHSIVEDRNWNSLWESNFEPVYVDDFVSLRADFHPPTSGYEWDLVITPKMSFGTGHHATTWMMIRQMRDVGFSNKRVLDFGTGTGVLAILAAKLGAIRIDAIDYDEWSISNARENLARNFTDQVNLVQASDAGSGNTYDVMLANINRNIILDNMDRLKRQLAAGGVILFSGLLEEDHAPVLEAAERHGLQEELKVARDKWLCLRFSNVGSLS